MASAERALSIWPICPVCQRDALPLPKPIGGRMVRQVGEVFPTEWACPASVHGGCGNYGRVWWSEQSGCWWADQERFEDDSRDWQPAREAAAALGVDLADWAATLDDDARVRL